MKYSIRKTIEERISSMKSGSVLVVGDFTDVAESKTASKTLVRLCKDGVIEKLMRGVYRKPEEAPVTPDEVAKALARENSWKLIPCGETALHLFGLSEKKPKVWTYISDGTYRTYKYSDDIISFTHTTVKAFRQISEKTSVLAEIVRAYGKSHVPYEKLMNAFSYLKKTEISRILTEAQEYPSWIYREIRKLFQSEIIKKEN